MKLDGLVSDYPPGEAYRDMSRFPGWENACAFDHEKALSEMLADGILFANSRHYQEGGTKKYDGGETIVLFVNANDLFSWGTADAVNVTYAEVPELYRLHKLYKNGSSIWACIKEGAPQKPVIDHWKKQGMYEDYVRELALAREKEKTRMGAERAPLAVSSASTPADKKENENEVKSNVL